MKDDKDVMIECNIRLLRDGTVLTSYGGAEEVDKVIGGVLAAGLLVLAQSQFKLAKEEK